SLASLRAQVEAGAQAVQLFDSWAGALSPDDYRDHVLDASARIFSGLSDLGVPRIHFGVGTGELLGLLGAAGADVVGVDWRGPLGGGLRRGQPGQAPQGDPGPPAPLGPWGGIGARGRGVLSRGRPPGGPGVHPG